MNKNKGGFSNENHSVTKNYDDMSRKAANIISAQIISKPNCVLGLATGSTPIGVYADNLIDRYQKGDLDFSQVSTVNLDEYRGLDHENDQSYYYFMMNHLFKHVNIDVEKTHVPDGTEPDSDKACSDYEAIIESYNGVDLQLLGLGHNGHIGFNEPADEFSKTTNCVDLTESTIQANARFFEKIEDVAYSGLHHGNRNDHESEKDSSGSQRKRQSRDREKSVLRTCSSSGACIYPAVPS